MQNKLDTASMQKSLAPLPLTPSPGQCLDIYDKYMYIIDLMRIREVFWNVRCNLEADLSELQEKLNLLSGVFVLTS